MKNNLSISAKLRTLLALAVILCAVSVGSLSLFLFNRGFTENIQNSIDISAKGMLITLDDWKDSLQSGATGLSETEDVIDMFESENFKSLSDYIATQKSNMGVDFIYVTDDTGVILVGGSGSLFSSKAVMSALQGNEGFAYEAMADVSFAMVYTAPLIGSDGKKLGSIAVGYDLTKNEFVDRIKDSYGVECTMFNKILRASTTLVDENGVRESGTTLDNSKIVTKVYVDKEAFKGTVVLFDQPYLATYVPLVNSDGSVNSMGFIAESKEGINKSMRQTVMIVVPFVIIFVVILMVVGTIFINSIVNPLKKVKNAFSEISKGDADLTQRIEVSTKDEIGQVVEGFNTFSGKLQTIISEVKNSKNELGIAGEDLSASTQDAASAITQIIANIESIHGQINGQNQSVHQTAGAVDEISSNISSLNKMIENQSAGVTQASAAVEEMIGNISSVNQSVDKMADSFGDLQSNAESGFTKQQSVNSQIEEIETESEMLQDANKAIASIASQTNLLAMNAAIEAAHAGEAGKGFSVVADEIRKLSETSTSQSKTIGNQLKKIKESINQVVTASSETSTAMSVISQKIQETDQLVLQIKAAMEEQNEGSRQISEALKSMNDSTVEVRNASEEMERGNQQILEEIQHLQDSSTMMAQSMDEMAVGARKINETGNALTGISDKVKTSIDKIGSQIDLFKV